MKKIFCILSALVLIGCESANYQKVSGVPTSAEYSGWDIDHCTEERKAGVECIQHGGQIYVVNLESVKGAKLNQILVVQHALMVPKGNTERWCFKAEPAVPKLVEGTGVAYIAAEYFRGC
ncbi:hypothetical protein NBRC116493_02660 [Aurantivibrio infirmus]